MKFEIGQEWIQRQEKQPSKSGYLYDATAIVESIDDEWIYCTIHGDIYRRKVPFDHNGVREDGKAWLVNPEDESV